MSESLPAELKLVIKTKNGPVCGYVDKKNEKSYYKFKGIPYAQPPVGNLRFKPPLPAKPWTSMIDCTQEASKPFSYTITEEIIGTEDCLYLDVTSPNIKPGKPLPVMFWIGSYIFTCLLDDHYDPTFLIDEGVIFVRCNFRLGPFGFLSVNDFTAPGNCGLKDIVLALKWVKDNICEFGGDPNNVTIFGSSSGGTLVHLLMLSPMATGLFHKAIVQSACALNTWSLTKNPIQPAMELAKELGIEKTFAVDIVEALKTTPASKIMEAIAHLQLKKNVMKDEAKMDPFFRPCIEQDFEGEPAFLTKSPLIILKSGNFNKVPFIIGSNNIEASILQFITEDFYNFEKYNKNPELIVPKLLSADTEESRLIGQQLLKFYLDGDTELRQDTKTQYIQLVSDYYFLYYVHKTIQLHSQYAPGCPIYYYIQNYGGGWDIPDQNLDFLNSMGHGADIPFVFGLKLPSMDKTFKGSRDSVRTRKRVVRMWTNFAKYGDPTPNEEDRLLQIKWDTVENKDKLNYLCIGSELTKGRNPFSERMEFWEQLHNEHRLLRVKVYFNDMGVAW